MLPAASYALLAEIDRFQAMGQRLRPGGKVDYTSQIVLVLVAVGVVGAILLAVRFCNRHKEKQCNHPRRLFRELCRCHRLNREQDQLLREVAEALALEHPSRLFLEPELFDRAFDQGRLANGRMGDKRDQLSELRNRLFGLAVDPERAVGA